MTTSSTPPSFPPRLQHVLTSGRRAGTECWQGGILEGRNCFVLIKGLCKFTTMNKSPSGPMSPSFPLLQQPAAVPSVSEPQAPSSWLPGLCQALQPSCLSIHRMESRHSQRCSQSRISLAALSVGKLSCHLIPSRAWPAHALGTA